MPLRRLARRHGFVGIAILQFIQRECDAVGETHGFCNRLRQIAKHPRHLEARLQMPLGIGLKFFPGGMDRGFFQNAGQNVLQRTSRGMVVKYLIGRQQRHAGGGSNTLQFRQTPCVVAAIQQACREPYAFCSGTASLQPVEHFQYRCRFEAMRQRQDEQLPFCKIQQIIEGEMTLALLRFELAARQ